MAAINRYTQAVDNALEQYIPLPFDTMFKAAQATQQRYDQAIAEDTATQTGLASIEARSPGYKQYIDKAISGYRGDMSNLIKQYNGRLDDPEFRRQAKEVQNRYANDPAFQTIKLGNEAIKRSQDLEARLRADGKLYISDLPNFSGLDANGRLTAYQGAPQTVNTLDDWTNMGKIAHSSTEDIGTVTTNEKNLNRWRNTILNDQAGQAKLAQAYMQQGMSPQQAQAAVKSSIQGLINQFGVERKTNIGLLSYMAQREDAAYRKQRDAAEDQLKRDLAKAKAAGKAPEEMTLPTVRQNDLGFSTGINSNSSQFVPTFGSSTINTPKAIGNGTFNFSGGYYRQANTSKNESYNGILGRQTGGAKITNGQDEGLHNVAVTPKGDVITSKQKGEFVTKNGKTYYKYKGDDGKSLMREAQPRTMRVITDKGTGSVYYTPVAEQEAMRYMGATGAYWEGRKTVGQQYGLKPNQVAPAGLRSVTQAFDFADVNTVATLERIGSQRGYDINSINKVFNKTSKGEKLNANEALLLDNIITDINNISRYNQFNKGEFNDQGKRTNIYSGVLKTSNDNTTGTTTQDEAYQKYLKEQED